MQHTTDLIAAHAKGFHDIGRTFLYMYITNIATKLLLPLIIKAFMCGFLQMLSSVEPCIGTQCMGYQPEIV